MVPGSLRASLKYGPQVLRFGTSGRRGEVIHLTQLEIYINALAELEYLQGLPMDEGGIRKGDALYYASDLRPSSTRFVPEQGGRGEIAQAIELAIRDAGMTPVNLGQIPTPALTYYAMQQGKGSIMVTGSHIPFERNGYKTNSAKGELLKKDESPINARVEQVRKRVYEAPATNAPFGTDGLLKGGPRQLTAPVPDAAQAYIRRYVEFFGAESLRGMKLLAYQHSAVGRDMLVEILERLGATVIPAGRSDTFVPIDTEAIDAEQLQVIQRLADAVWQEHGRFDAVVSTDGDSDRPLILAVNPAGSGCKVRFFGGDLVGMVVAEFLGADAIVVPISCNDAIDRGALKHLLEPKTRIGSPFVVAGMDRARAAGKQRVCGWEANGGFLTGSDFRKNGKVLKALPTRDAILPILGVLQASRARGGSVSDVFDALPKRYSKASLLRKFPRPTSLKIVERYSPAESNVADVVFAHGEVAATDSIGAQVNRVDAERLNGIRTELSKYFSKANGFGEITQLNYIDGVRIYFSNGDVAHVRPSGNADELRIYAVADTQKRADEIAAMGVREPGGILRELEKAVAG